VILAHYDCPMRLSDRYAVWAQRTTATVITPFEAITDLVALLFL